MSEVTRSDVRRKRASMREVAELADVAISSVSRVLSQHPDVSADMRERVLIAVQQLEYEPDFLAQSLRRGATLSVGYVVGDISNPLIATITSGAESVLRSADYSMLLMNSRSFLLASNSPARNRRLRSSTSCSSKSSSSRFGKPGSTRTSACSHLRRVRW